MTRVLCMFCLALLTACSESIDTTVARCDVLLESAEPVAAAVGTWVQAYGSPLTDKSDTALFLDSTRVEIQSVERINCETCDDCRLEAGCGDCTDCPSCAPICSEECSESIEFTVPEVGVGPHELLFYNAHGSSNTLTFEVLESPEGDPSDADTGTPID
ncbi:MAG: hypothetical protein VX519_08280 [Myxococcota bacterium]|nr:hypothetical protein [Myxococcota bacterium]